MSLVLMNAVMSFAKHRAHTVIFDDDYVNVFHQLCRPFTEITVNAAYLNGLKWLGTIVSLLLLDFISKGYPLQPKAAFSRPLNNLLHSRLFLLILFLFIRCTGYCNLLENI